MALYRRDLAYVHAEGFEGWIRSEAPALLKTLRQGGVRPGALVLDLGCGSGLWAERLARHGYRTLGIDASPAMIALARRRVPGAVFRRATIASAALPPCDAITAFGECFNYRVTGSPPLGTLFARIRRTLRRGGLFLFDVREPAGRAVPARFVHVTARDWVVIAHSTQRGRSLTRSITTFRRVGRAYRRALEVHRLRLYPRSEVMGALRLAGFTARIWTPARRLAGDGGVLTRFVARA
jgi:SAM-dependent methyltransferase